MSSLHPDLCRAAAARRRAVLVLAAVVGCNDPAASADTAGSSSTGAAETSRGTTEPSSGAADTTSAAGSSSDPVDTTSSTGQESGSTTTEPPCGNGVIDPGEQCEPGRLGGEDCISQGFDGGTLGCTAECTLDLGACTTTEVFCGPPAGGLIDVGTLVVAAMIPMVGGPVVGVDMQVEVIDSSLGELAISVEHLPSATSVVLVQNICGSANDIDAIFDQDALAPPDCVEPVAIEGNVLPLEDLDAFVGLPDPSGPWELTIVDTGPGDTDPGALITWCVRFEIENGPP